MLSLIFSFLMLLVILIPKQGSPYKKSYLNEINNSFDDASWPNLWFPNPPNYQNNVNLNNVPTAISIPSVEQLPNNSNSKDWKGLWFPNPPNFANKLQVGEPTATFKGSVEKHECDNGKYNLGIDFDPEDKRQTFNYLCFGRRSEYAPNLHTTAVIREYTIPTAYEPPVKCLNETIEYDEVLPTFGPYRFLAPKFGTYRYLPPQRWLHSLADGAIVLVYHPCAFSGQIEQLQNTLRGCLYRHVITPTQHLTTERPLALLAWGKSLLMSVVDDAIVVKFIQDNAKLGLRQKQQKLQLSSKLYDAGLLAEAHLVTDEQDTEICGYKQLK